ncbi:MAG: L-threonate dehydrogenase [Pseudomonadota bacterium]
MTDRRVAVIGLGSMGYGLAQSCHRAGLVTYGFDTVAERVARFLAEGGAAGPLYEVAGTLDAVAVVVVNAAQAEAVLFGPDALVDHLKPGAVVLGCTTVSPDFARTMEKSCAARGVHYLDAPLSGGAAKAATGALTVMAAGRPEAFTAAAPILEAAAGEVFRLGDAAGAGSAMKSINQMLAGIHIAAMAEAMTFGITQGVAPERFLEVISKCAGSSWMLENRAPHVIEGDYTPRSSVTIWPKDLGIVLDIARDAGFEAPLTATALRRYEAAVDLGLGPEDDAAVAKVYARQAGVDLPRFGQ